jgi:hypothetical protein
MSDFFKNININTVLIVAGVLILVYILFQNTSKADAQPRQEAPVLNFATEGFTDEDKEDKEDKEEGEGSPVVLEKNMASEEIAIKPTYVDSDVRSLMSGSGFIPPSDIIPPWGPNVESKMGLIDGLDDGAGGSLGLHYNLSSPACCSSQWPVPFKLPYDKFVCENRDKFVSSPFVGNNAWQNSGCVCLTKKQHENLVNRGGNA